MDLLVPAVIALILIVTGNFLQRWWRRKTGCPDHDDEPPVVIEDVKRMMETLAKPALLIKRTSDTTTSWFGGCPPESQGFEWPRCDGRPMAFLACLNLSQPDGLLDWLPSSGRLLFFYDMEETPWGFDPKDRDGFRVIHVPSPTQNQTGFVTPPDDLPPEHRLKKSHVGFSKAQTYPSPLLEEVSRLNLGSKQSDTWSDLSSAIYKGCPHHQLGGWPDAVQSPEMDKECQLASNGVYCGNSDGYSSEQAEKLGAGSADWSLLLQFDSDDELEVMWGDCGMLYFWVKREEARNGDFSGAWVILQCC